jgi:hypothetical protein
LPLPGEPVAGSPQRPAGLAGRLRHLAEHI